MNLTINGQVIGTWNNLATTTRPYTQTITQELTINSLRTSIKNGGWPEALIIDRIEIDGTQYQTEDPTTQSTGSWNPATGCSQGTKQSEWLQCASGWFDYTATHGKTLNPQTDPNPNPDPEPDPGGVPLVILDSDMGPDIDDALALAMLHAYEKLGRADIAAVTVSRNSDIGARYVDLLNTFYGRPDIPIGVYRGSTPQDGNEYYYTGDVVSSGRYAYDVHENPIPQGFEVMRRVLADAPDQGVILVQIGYSTNTAKLLQSGPDEISPLTGRELVEAKVKLLSVMGGRNDSSATEFNIQADVPSARLVFGSWPGHLIQSDANLGQGILYPLASIVEDFDDALPHPIPDSYLNKPIPWHQANGDFYDMRSWDLTSVMAGLEDPSSYFPVTGPGSVTVDDQGRSRFVADPDGLHRSLGTHWQLTSADKQRVVARMVEMVTQAP